MGTNCRITLPPYVKAQDVAKILGVLFGLKANRVNVSSGYYVTVPGVRTETFDHSPFHCRIVIDSPLFSFPRHTLYFFEWGVKGMRGLNPYAETVWQIAGRRLVEIFGGQVDYNDKDDVDVDFSMQPNEKLAKEDDDEAFLCLQDIILTLEPISKEDMDTFDVERGIEESSWDSREISADRNMIDRSTW